MGYALAPSPLAATWAAKLLHPALEGRGTVAMWDEDGGADPETPTLKANGSLTGVKIAVPNADVADTLIVTAEGGRHFAVSAADAAIEPARALDPTRPLFTVRFDGAAGEELSGDFNRGWHAIAVMAAAESVGVAARVTQMAVEYAKERKQFGRAIGSYQAVSHACAQMYLETEGARNVAYWAAWALDHDPENAALAAYSAKAYASDAAVGVARSALQVHGGIGFTWEHDLHLFLKRAEANAHAFGDARWHREQVASLLL
jgi:alkylation response protein AidB-like acyl-CoA dehydrogenase